MGVPEVPSRLLAGLVIPELPKTMKTNALRRCGLSTLNWVNSLIIRSIQHSIPGGMMVAFDGHCDCLNSQKGAMTIYECGYRKKISIRQV